MKNQVFRYGSWLGVLAALAVLVSLFACSGESSTMETPTSDPTPTVPPAPTPTPTPISTPTAPSVPVSAVQIDNDTTWQELFDDFTPAEQDCIRTEVEGELDSLLGERVMTNDDLTDWQVSLFECLTPETARSVYASLLVEEMVTDETYDVTEREIACVRAWVAGADVHRLIRGLAEEDPAVLGEAMSGVIPCLLDFFMPDFLAEMGIDEGSLTDDERTCLNEWMGGYDWANFMTALMEEDLGIMGEFLPGLTSCAPGPFLALAFEDTVLDVDTLTNDERKCLEDWLTELDWDAVFATISAAAFAEEDEAYSVLAEAFGLLACIPDLDLEDFAGSGGADYQAADFTDATRIGIGESVEGVIDYAGEVDIFELRPDADQFYRIDVALGTLDDSVLTIYDPDGWEIASNDDYGSGAASRVDWRAPSSDAYYVVVSAFDDSTGSYTLTVEAVYVTDDYPNSPDVALRALTPGQSIEGTIDYEYDVDLFSFSADAGESYQVDVFLGTLEDSVLTIYDANGWDIAYNDDYGDGFASRIIWEPDATGVYYVEVSGFGDTGSYALAIALQ